MLLAIMVSDLTNVVYVNNQLTDVFMFVLGSVLASNRGVIPEVPELRNSILKPAELTASAARFGVIGDTLS